MTPADEWDRTGDLRQMAGLIHAADRAAGGYARLATPERDAVVLFVAGLCRDLWPLIVDGRVRGLVADAELLMGEPGRRHGFFLDDVAHGLNRLIEDGRSRETAQEFAASVAFDIAGYHRPDFATAVPDARDRAIEAVRRSPRTPKGADYLRPFNGTDAVLCGRLRCLLANPFRPAPAFDPGWRTAAVRAIAAGVLADRDFARLPVLADALEDAGCDDPDLLAHARGPGPHVFGCRAVAVGLGHPAG